MLKFPEPIVYDEVGNKLLSLHICRMLLDAIEDSITLSILTETNGVCDVPWHQYISENPDILCTESFMGLFPDGMPAEKCLNTVAGLYSLLLSPEEHVPTIAMEFLLARSISYMIICNAEAHQVGANHYFSRSMKSDFSDLKDLATIRTAIARQVAVEAIEVSDVDDLTIDQIETMSDEELYERFQKQIDERFKTLQVYDEHWLDFCFWDADYEFLDLDYFDTVIDSSLCDELGIEKDREFILPENWWESTGFRWKDEERDIDGKSKRPLILF